MKQENQEKAKELYFQTNMTKAEIADSVGVCRRTILRWCKEDNWDKLRESSRIMPALVAEKCYFVLNNMLTRMVDESSYLPVTLKEAQTVHYLAATIKKLKNRSTINESMEMFNFFLEGLKKKDPALAAQMLPQVEEYLASRSLPEVTDFLHDELKRDPHPDPNAIDKVQAEQIADQKDLDAFDEEFKKTGNYDQAIENWEKAGYTINTTSNKTGSVNKVQDTQPQAPNYNPPTSS